LHRPEAALFHPKEPTMTDVSYVIAAPELMTAAASDLAGIESTLSAAHAAAATSTTQVLAAAEDEVSAAIAGLFSDHGQQFQSLGAQAAEFHRQFARTLNGAGSAYAAAEAANAAPAAGLADLLSPWKLLTGRQLVGNGTDGAATTDGCSATAVTAGPVQPGSTAAGAVTQGCSATAARAGPAGRGLTTTSRAARAVKPPTADRAALAG
jgi:hypothetical protein